MIPGYRTQFEGHLQLDRPLSPEHYAYLDRFLHLRHVACQVENLEGVPDPLRQAVGLPLGVQGAYFVGLNFQVFEQRNLFMLPGWRFPEGQPKVVCHWQLNTAGLFLTYPPNEKPYEAQIWLQYVLDHFLIPWGYRINGTIRWRWENEKNFGTIYVQENKVEVQLPEEDQEMHLAEPAEPIMCDHKNARQTQLVCTHLAGQLVDNTYWQWFRGQKQHFNMICSSCAEALGKGTISVPLQQICRSCHRKLSMEGLCDGIVGQPEVLVRQTSLSLVTTPFTLDLSARMLAIQPIDTEKESVWLTLTETGDLFQINLTVEATTHLLQLPASKLDLTQPISFQIALAIPL